MADRHQAQAYPLRLPEDLKARVAAHAEQNGRSLNAEIAGRLEQSFGPSLRLSEEARIRVEIKSSLWKCSFDEALERIVLAGTSHTAPEVLLINATPGMTAAELLEVFKASRGFIAPESEAVVRYVAPSEQSEKPAPRRAAAKKAT